MRGLHWVSGAFAIFRVAPVRQLLLNLGFLFASTIVVALPLIGFAAIWLLFPALMVTGRLLSRAWRNAAIISSPRSAKLPLCVSVMLVTGG